MPNAWPDQLPTSILPSGYRQCCHVGNSATACDFAGDLKDSTSTSNGMLCIFRRPHISSNKMGLREANRCVTQQQYLIGRWFVGPGHRCVSASGGTEQSVAQHQTQTHEVSGGGQEVNRQHGLRSSTRAQLQPTGISLFVSEDSDAVIKMIIKGRSPTMRHVSRTHRVNVDW